MDYLVVNTQSRNIAGIPSSFLSHFSSILASIWSHCCCKGSEWNVNLNPVGSSNFYWWYLTLYAQRPTSTNLTIIVYIASYNWLVSYFHHPKLFLRCPHHQNGPHPRISTSFLPTNWHLPTRSRSQCLSENSCAKWSSIRRATSWQSDPWGWYFLCTVHLVNFGMVNVCKYTGPMDPSWEIKSSRFRSRWKSVKLKLR